MAKNDFLDKQKARDRAVFEAGEQIGMQRMIDVISIVLHDPEIMGKDTFGKDRMKRVFDGVKKGMDFWHPAYTAGKEADYYQDKMDEALRAVYGDETIPFHERYPDLKRYDYNKARKGWAD